MSVFDSDTRTAERRAQLGVREARGRCRKAISEGDVDSFYVAYIETVLWMSGLDELYQREVSDYDLRRTAHPGGKVVEALRMVRDKGLHQLVALHDANEWPAGHHELGPSYPDGRYPVWLHSTAMVLPDPTVFGRDREKRRLYDERLAGLPLWASLAAARDFLSLYVRGMDPAGTYFA